MDLTSKETFLLISIGSVILFGFFILLILAFLITHQKKRILIEKEKAEMDIQLRLAVATASNEIRDETLQTVGRELHDSVNHMLAIILLHVNNIKIDPVNLPEKIKPLIVKTIDEVRSISEGMDTSLLSKSNILVAMKYQLDLVRQASDLHWELDSATDITFLDHARQIILFRLFQEMLQNVIKHSKADFVKVALTLKNGMVIFEFSDNGIGIDPIINGEGQGLKNMKKRLKWIKGEIERQSNTGEGTKYIIKIPHEY